MGKKRSIVLIVLVVILLLLVVGLGGYIVYDNAFSKVEINGVKEESNDSNKTDNKEPYKEEGIEIYNVGKGFKAMEEVAEVIANGNVEYDLDNDGKKEKIEVLKYYEGDYALNFKGLLIDDKEVLIDSSIVGLFERLYIVDLNKNDGVLNVVIELTDSIDGRSASYYLFDETQNGKVSSDNYIGFAGAASAFQAAILINGNGKIVSLDYFERAVSPKLSFEYLEYDGIINRKKADLSNISSQEFVIGKSDLYYYTFEKNLDKVCEKYHSGHTMEESGIYMFEKDTKIKIVKFNVDGRSAVEAKLENGRTIYIFPHSGYLAG